MLYVFHFVISERTDDDEIGEGEETNRKRIVYTRDVLLKYNKEKGGAEGIPEELLKDAKSPNNGSPVIISILIRFR